MRREATPSHRPRCSTPNPIGDAMKLRNAKASQPAWSAPSTPTVAGGPGRKSISRLVYLGILAMALVAGSCTGSGSAEDEAAPGDSSTADASTAGSSAADPSTPDPSTSTTTTLPLPEVELDLVPAIDQLTVFGADPGDDLVVLAVENRNDRQPIVLAKQDLLLSADRRQRLRFIVLR